MGLDESYAQIRGQILLMEPIPPINKVYSLILQEEKQREVASFHPSNSASQVAFAVKNSSQKGVSDPKQKQGKKDRPLCSHCGVLGHSVDKCFKLHGYPPNYGKGKGKPQAVHLVSEESPISSIGDSSLMLTQSQYQHLLSMLSAQVLQPAAHSDQRDSGSVGKVYSTSHSLSQVILI